MHNFQPSIHLFLLLALIIVHSSIQKEILIGETIPVTIQSKTISFILKYTSDEVSAFSYLKINTSPQGRFNPAHIYITKQETGSNWQNDYSSHSLGINELHLPTSYWAESTKIVISILCDDNCEFTLFSKWIQNWTIKENTELNLNCSVLKAKGVVLFEPAKAEQKQLLIYSYTENVKDLVLDIIYSSDKIPVKQINTNALGSWIDMTSSPFHSYQQFSISLTCKDENAFLGLGVRYWDGVNEINILDTVYGHTLNSVHNKNCFRVANLLANKTVLINANIYTQIAKLVTYNSSHIIEETYPIFFNNHLRILSNELINHTFCIEEYGTPGKTEVMFQFQMLYEDEIVKSQQYSRPLINGVHQISYLPDDSVNYYRIFGHFPNKTKVNAHLISLTGKPELYGYICDTFPNCDIDKDKFRELMQNNQLVKVDNLSKQYILSDDVLLSHPSSQYLTIVKCGETLDHSGCTFVIEMNTTGYPVEMLPDVEYLKLIASDADDTYLLRIVISDQTQINKITIDFAIITGNCNIHIYTDDTFTSEVPAECAYTGGTAKCVISNNIHNKYFINVHAENSAWYSLKYTLNKPNIHHWWSGVANIQTLTKAENLKTFDITNRSVNYFKNKTDYTPYMIGWAALNCKINVFFNSRNYDNMSNLQITVSPSDTIFVQGTYTFSVSVASVDGGDGDGLCTVIITGTEEQFEKGLVWSDGYHHTFTLNNQLNKLSFVYPLLYTGPNDQVIIDLSFTGEVGIIATLEINNNYIETYNVYKPDTIVWRDLWDENCLKVPGLCTVRLEIAKNEKYEQNENIQFYLVFKTGSKIPKYLSKDVLQPGNLLPGECSYFYTDIKASSRGEISFDFLKGNANVYARIVMKNQIESDNDWNNRVKLPSNKSIDLLYYDSYTRLITFKESDTEKCTAGCELYITVENAEVFQGKSIWSQYQIWVNTDETRFINIPFNRFVTSQILDSTKDKYYTVKVSFDTDRLVFTFISTGCTLYMTANNEIPSESHHQWIISGISNNIYEINGKDEHIKLSSLKGINFKLAVHCLSSSGTPNHNHSNDYSLKITPQYKNTPNISEITSVHPDVCETTAASNLKCSFISRVNKDYDIVDKLYFTVSSRETQGNSIEIYASFIEQTAFNGIKYSESISKYLPSPEEHAKHIQGKNYIDVTANDFDERNVFILWTISTPVPMKIALNASYNCDVNVSNLLSNTDQVFFIPAHKTLNLVLWNSGRQELSYIVETEFVHGQGKVKYKDKVETDKEIEVSGNYVFNVISSKNAEIALKPSLGSEAALVKVKYKYRDNRINMSHLQYDKLNIIEYTDSFFPVFTYVEIGSNREISINLKIGDIKHSQNYNIKLDWFDVSAYVVQKDFIINKWKDPTLEPEGEELPLISRPIENETLIKYSNKNNDVTKEIVSNGSEYLYWQIKKSIQNTNMYTRIVSTLSLETPSSKLPQKRYFYETLVITPQNIFTYRLDKNTESGNDIYFEIEFAESSDERTNNQVNIDFSVEPYTQSPLYTNSTDIDMTAETKQGKRIIHIKTTPEIQSLLFSWIPIYDTGNTVDYLIKYKTVTDLIEPPTYINTKAITSKAADNSDGKYNLTVTFKNIKSTDTTISSRFYVYSFPKAQIPNKRILETICSQSQMKEAFFMDVIEPTKDTEDISYSYISTEKSVYFQVVAAIQTGDYEENLISFDIISTDDKGKPDSDDSSDSSDGDGSKVWIVIIIIIWIWIGLGLIAFWYLNMKKKGRSADGGLQVDSEERFWSTEKNVIN